MGGLRGLARALIGWAALSLALGLQAQCDPLSAPSSSGPCGPQVLTFSQIQGAQHSSPWAGQWVRSAGVVTLVVPGDAYLQDPVGEGDPQTSDAAYVPLKAGHGWRAGQWWQFTARVEEWPMAGGSQTGPRPTRTVLALPRELSLWAEGCAVQAPIVQLPLRPEIQPSAPEIMWVEVQNNQGRALHALAAALNARVGEPQWAAVAPSPDGAGEDAVALGLLYRSARLRPFAPARNDTRAVHHRPPLAQTVRTAHGAALLVVNHFKSRQCLRAKGADQEQRDGQGCFNHRRRRQAQALHRFVESLQGQGAPRAPLLLGDFNAHTYEAPLTELGDLGWQDLLAHHAPGAWSYVCAGQADRLDHVLASPSLGTAVRSAGA